MTDFLLVKTAINTQEGAQKIAEFVVKNRLAACAHVTGPFTSTYWWKGKMEVETEWECEAKTRKDLYSALEQAIRANHPYEEPEIIATSLTTGSSSYLNWIVAETTQKE